MKYLIERINFNDYQVGDKVIIHYWYNNDICPVKIIEKRGHKYLVSHNIPESEIKNAPDELLTINDIISLYRN
jgi:hypothetical protein